MTFDLIKVGQEESAPEVETPEVEEPEVDTPEADAVEREYLGNIGEVNLNDIAIWQEGGYDSETGAFAQLQGYICTEKFIEVTDKGSYNIVMKDARFHTVINEYGSDGSLIASTDLVNGDMWIPDAETSYIGVSMYFPNWKAITFANYDTKFTYNLMSLDITKV